MLIQIFQQVMAKNIPSSEQVSVMELILKILNLVYEQKLKLVPANQTDLLSYHKGINQVFNKRTKMDMMLDAAVEVNDSSGAKVSSVIELKETFDTLRDAVHKLPTNKTIVELVLNLLCLVSESVYR